MGDWLDYIGKRFGIQEITDYVREVEEFDREFDRILDQEGLS
jgi:hypothetical protein